MYRSVFIEITIKLRKLTQVVLIFAYNLYLDIPVICIEQRYKKDDKAPIVGPSSYKEHGFRMLMIWASGLSPDVPLARELYDALSAVDKKTIAGKNSIFILRQKTSRT